jgi:hypothetical protein
VDFLVVFLDPPPHNETKASAEINRLRFRNEEITLGDRKDTTGTSEEDETTKDLEACPHTPKKLHSPTVKEYAAPLVNRLFGRRMGTDNDNESDFEEVRLEKCCWRASEEEELETVKEMDFQSRPPEPTEELKSNDKSSQAPSSLGTFNVTTTGDKSSESTETVML